MTRQKMLRWLLAALLAIPLTLAGVVVVLVITCAMRVQEPVDEKTGTVYYVAFSPDGKQALSGGVHGSLHLWDVKTGVEVRSVEGTSKTRIHSAAFSPNGKRVIYAIGGHHDEGCWLLDLDSGRELPAFRRHKEGINSLAWTPDGKQVLIGSDDRMMRLWDLATGAEVRTFVGHSAEIRAVAVSPNGRYALSGSGTYAGGVLTDGTCRLWDLATAKELRQFEGHDGIVTGVAFSADSRRVLSGSWDNTARLWNVDTGRELRRFDMPSSVNSVALTQDGRGALLGCQGGQVWLWDTETGIVRQRFEGLTTEVRAVALSPDGNLAITGAGEWRYRNKNVDMLNPGAHDPIDCAPQLWDVATGKLIFRLGEK